MSKYNEEHFSSAYASANILFSSETQTARPGHDGLTLSANCPAKVTSAPPGDRTAASIR